MTPLHADELAIDTDLVRRLVARSFPQHADLSVRPLRSSGSSNALFRLGEELLVRLPRQPGGSATIEKEARWSPVIAEALGTGVPEVVGVGDPGFGYPERWALTRWLQGRTPAVPWDASLHGSSRGLAHDLARTVTRLRAAEVPASALADPQLSWYRGGPLTDVDSDFRAAVEASAQLPGLDLDLRRAVQVWDRALRAEPTDESPPRWYHGDLLAENLLVRDGRLAAVLDLGGLAVGDPTVDLVVAWEVLDADGREAFRRALAVDDATWARAKGWALLIAMLTFPYYWHTMPSRCAARRAMAVAVLDAS